MDPDIGCDSKSWIHSSKLEAFQPQIAICGYPPLHRFCWQESHWYWWYSLASYMIPPKGLGSIPSFIRNFSRFNIWVCLKIRQDIMVHHCFHSKFFLVFRSLGYLPFGQSPLLLASSVICLQKQSNGWSNRVKNPHIGASWWKCYSTSSSFS